MSEVRRPDWSKITLEDTFITEEMAPYIEKEGKFLPF